MNYVQLEIEILKKIRFNNIKIVKNLIYKYKGRDLFLKLLDYEEKLFKKMQQYEEIEWQKRMKKSYGWKDKDFEPSQFDLEIGF